MSTASGSYSPEGIAVYRSQGRAIWSESNPGSTALRICYLMFPNPKPLLCKMARLLFLLQEIKCDAVRSLDHTWKKKIPSKCLTQN